MQNILRLYAIEVNSIILKCKSPLSIVKEKEYVMDGERIVSISALVLLIALVFWTPLHCLAYPEPIIHSGWAATPPTIEGTLTGGEWTSAAVRDFTLEMRSRADGTLQKTLDARFYVQNNWTHVFAAIEIFNDDYEAQNFANQWNGLTLLFEDDNDGVVDAGDNGEGITTWAGSPFYTKNDLYYTGTYWDADANAGQTNDGEIAWSHTNPTQGAIGNWTFEMMIPLEGTDGDLYDLTISTLPETIGFKLWFQEPAKGTDGVYPDDPTITQNIQEISNGTTFGDLVIHPLYTLTITTTTGGTTTPTPGEHQYPYGTIVNVLAEPDVCYVFDYWELDGFDVGSSNPISVTMDQNHTLHAVFRLIYYDLTITTTTGGTTNPTAGSYSHPCGSVVDVLAMPSAGYVFDYWELDGFDVGSSNPISVTMDQNHTLKAVFSKIPVVGGYSTSISQTVSNPEIAYCTVLVVIFGLMIGIARSKSNRQRARN